MALYLKGEAAKTMDATSRLAGDTLKCTGLKLRLETLAPDKLTWIARTADLNAAETILPQHEQIVELYQDATRIFRGWATDPKILNYGVAVTVEGPWYWLRKMQLSTSITGLANTDDRPTVIFAEATIGSMITALLTRAIALGAPIAIGTIDAGWTVTKQQHTLASFADVLAALVAQVPDAVAWWSYAGTGTPTFNLTRRGSMSTVTHTVGAGTLADYEVALFPSRVPTRVELKYITRTTTFGYPQMVTQASGTAAAGRTQTIVVSGRELADFLPADDYETYEFQTVNANVTLGTLEPTLMNLMPEVAASRTQFPSPAYPRTTDVDIANGEVFRWYNSASSGTYGGYQVFPQPIFQCVDFDDPATAVSRVGKHLVITPLPPDWASAALANLQHVKLRGRMWHVELLKTWNFGSVTDVENIPDWVTAFPWTQTWLSKQYWAPGYSSTTSNPQTNVHQVNFYAFDFEIEAYLTTTSQTAKKTLYKPADYEYTVPAAGLAANLLSAQSFTPAEGRIELLAVDGVPDLTDVLARKFNISGGRTELSTMAAMARAVEHDLVAGTTRIELGAPARLDFGARGGTRRGTPQANITL